MVQVRTRFIEAVKAALVTMSGDLDIEMSDILHTPPPARSQHELRAGQIGAKLIKPTT
jgi:hypothetical protein